jgi:hypothetical protein
VGRRSEWEGVWPLLSAATAAAVLWLGSGCSPDIFDVEVALKTQRLAADFGAPRGNIPDVTCDPAMADACTDAVPTLAQSGGSVVDAAAPYGVTLELGCDARTSRCYAQAAARLTVGARVLDGEDAGDQLGRKVTGFVRGIDVAYTVPTNTLTFDVPAATLFVGPPGTRRETDPGVVAVDALAPVAAGAPVDEERHLAIESGSPARKFIEQSVKGQRAFVFVVVVAPRLEGGAPIPAGALAVELSPRITIGLPR